MVFACTSDTFLCRRLSQLRIHTALLIALLITCRFTVSQFICSPNAHTYIPYPCALLLAVLLPVCASTVLGGMTGKCRNKFLQREGIPYILVVVAKPLPHLADTGG